MNMEQYFDPTLILIQADKVRNDQEFIQDIKDGELTYREMAKKHICSSGYIALFKDYHFPGWRIEQKMARIEASLKKIEKTAKKASIKIRNERIKDLRATGFSYRKISSETGWSLGTIGNVLNCTD